MRGPPGNRAIKGTRLDPVHSDAPEPHAGLAVSVAQEQFDAKGCSNCNHPQEKAMPLQLIAGSGWQLLAIVAFGLALAFVFFLVIRQNRKDFEEIEAWLAEEKLKS
jgi:hypothetical protein